MTMPPKSFDELAYQLGGGSLSVDEPRGYRELPKKNIFAGIQWKEPRVAGRGGTGPLGHLLCENSFLLCTFDVNGVWN